MLRLLSVVLCVSVVTTTVSAQAAPPDPAPTEEQHALADPGVQALVLSVSLLVLAAGTTLATFGALQLDADRQQGTALLVGGTLVAGLDLVGLVSLLALLPGEPGVHAVLQASESTLMATVGGRF